DSSGETTENDGFSVVAPMKLTHRFSTAGSSASCWVLLNRCTSSTNSRLCRPLRPSSRRAASTAARTSLTPAVTAEIAVSVRLVAALTTYASVVLPVPGGPQSSSDIGASLSMRLRNGVPGAVRCLWPMTSSRVFGRILTASGAAARVARCSASSNKLSTLGAYPSLQCLLGVSFGALFRALFTRDDTPSGKGLARAGSARQVGGAARGGARGQPAGAARGGARPHPRARASRP